MIVEDERPINELLRRNMTLIGHECVQCFSAEDAQKAIQSAEADLVLLDVMLPGKDGFSLMPALGDTPVIFLTALGELNKRVHGLNLGADDYIVKPFETVELLARVQAVLRRTKKELSTFTLDDTTVDLVAHKVFYHHTEVDLTPQEFSLLDVLIRNRNIALSRDKLLELAWGFDFVGDTRTVDVHIQKLRKKLHWDSRIKTVYKIGYRLEV